ncbi:MAG: hypothetical protein WCJ58_02830 [bacterium]
MKKILLVFILILFGWLYSTQKVEAQVPTILGSCLMVSPPSPITSWDSFCLQKCIDSGKAGSWESISQSISDSNYEFHFTCTCKGTAFSNQCHDMSIIPKSAIVVIDTRCITYKLLGGTELCNRTCKQECIDLNQPCEDNNSAVCNSNLTWVNDSLVSRSNPIPTNPLEQLRESVNVLGVDFGPTEQAVPRMIRMTLLMVFSFIGLMSIIYGLIGLYKMSTAAESPEKFEEGGKIFKNAVLGTGLAFGSVFIAQIAALVSGMEEKLFNFYIIPKQGIEVDITQKFADEGPCLPEQKGTVQSTGHTYTCGANGKWQW